MNFFKTILIIIYFSLAGYGMLKLFLKDNGPFSIFGLIPLSFVAGLGTLGFLSNLIMLVRLRISFWILILPLFPLVVFGMSKINYKMQFASFGKRIKSLNPLAILLILIILFGIISVFLMSISFPLHFWDSRAIWGTKAKMIYGEGTIFSTHFLNEYRVHPHYRYPLLYPTAQAFIYFTLGQIDDWAVMLLVGLFFPLLIMFMYDLLRQATEDPEKALMGTAVLAMLPLFYRMDGPAHSGYADTPMALFFLVSFGVLYLWKKLKNRQLLIVGCILSAFLPLVKNEGTILMLLNLVWVSWPDSLQLNKENLQGILKNSLIFVLLVAIVVLPWIMLRSNIPDLRDEQYMTRLNVPTIKQNLNRIPTISSFYFRAFAGMQGSMTNGKYLWGGLWAIFILASIGSFIKRSRLEIRVFWLVILFCVFMGVIYEVAPDVGAMVSNFFRVMLSITPLLILLIMMQCESPFRRPIKK